VHVDDAAFVEDAQVHGFACQFIDAAHARFCFTHDIQMRQGLGAQFEQSHAEPVAIFGILNHIATGFQ